MPQLLTAKVALQFSTNAVDELIITKRKHISSSQQKIVIGSYEIQLHIHVYSARHKLGMVSKGRMTFIDFKMTEL